MHSVTELRAAACRPATRFLLGTAMLFLVTAGCDVGDSGSSAGSDSLDESAKTIAAETTATAGSVTAAKVEKRLEASKSGQPATTQPSREEHVVLTVNGKQVVVDLEESAAPNHVANFKTLVRRGFYNGNAFHRVVESGFVQAGDPNPQGDGTGSEGEPIAPEIKLKHVRGAVGMAREVNEINPEKKSLGSQFYVCLTDIPQFDNEYTVFGKVVEGLDVLEKIPSGDPDSNDIVPPENRTTIQKAEVRAVEMKTKSKKSASSQPSATAPPGDEYAVLETDVTTGDGKIVIDLFEENTPKHAENFKKLVREGFYDNLTFHRVIEGFMAQGGDPKGDGTGGPGYTLEAEIKLPHLRGSVAAARTGDRGNPDKRSSGSQFYICFEPQTNLDRLGYTVFGHVVKGMDVVDAITRGDRARNGLVSPGSQSKILKASIVPSSSVSVETTSPAK